MYLGAKNKLILWRIFLGTTVAYAAPSRIIFVTNELNFSNFFDKITPLLIFLATLHLLTEELICTTHHP
jgi:hypothetical protein